MINTAFSVANQMSAAFVKPRFSSWMLTVFTNVGSDIIQTMHRESAQVSKARVMWWRGTRVAVCVLSLLFLSKVGVKRKCLDAVLNLLLR